MKYREKTYRDVVNAEDLLSYEVNVRETELQIRSDIVLQDEAFASVYRFRNYIETYIKKNPNFLTSLTPLQWDAFAPAIIQQMMHAGTAANVGPMASVAGAIAEFVGRDLLMKCKNVIIENGGDIFLRSDRDRLVGIFTGDSSPWRKKIVLRIPGSAGSVGICTSSGTVGHSISLGRADAVSIISGSATLSDAVATSIGNMIKSTQDIGKSIERARRIEGVQGVLIVVKDKIGLWGDMELT